MRTFWVGTLSGSAWTEEAEDLATFHRKGDVANGGPVSAGIGKAEGLGLNHRTRWPDRPNLKSSGLVRGHVRLLFLTRQRSVPQRGQALMRFGGILPNVGAVIAEMAEFVKAPVYTTSVGFRALGEPAGPQE